MRRPFPVLCWSGPVGLGLFFSGLGVLLWGVSKVMAASNDDD
jgi:hypothetical protein